MALHAKKMEFNENNSSNSRLSMLAPQCDQYKADPLGHLSRYDAVCTQIVKTKRELNRPIDIVEVGAGELWSMRIFWGSYSDKKKDFIRSYKAFDIDRESLEDRNERFIENGNKHFKFDQIYKDLTVDVSLEMPDNSVDLYVNMEVIEHVQPGFIPSWIEEAHRVLRPGGKAYVSTPNHDGSNDKLPDDHVYEWGYQELREVLERHFTVEWVHGTFIQLPRLRRFLREGGDTRNGWTVDQLEMLEQRYGRHWLRVVAATPYPEISNNCNWLLRKTTRR